MRQSKQQKLTDDTHLLRQYRRLRFEQLDRAVNGPFGALMVQLVEILDQFTLHDGADLVTFVKSQNWTAVDQDTRMLCLGVVAVRIIHMREQAKLLPFDDDLNQPPSSVFLIVQQLIDGAH
jgi:hypothetical protein